MVTRVEKVANGQEASLKEANVKVAGQEVDQKEVDQKDDQADQKANRKEAKTNGTAKLATTECSTILAICSKVNNRILKVAAAVKAKLAAMLEPDLMFKPDPRLSNVRKVKGPTTTKGLDK
jgi:FlaG/FlaF family flagellin (archaellin)